MHFGSCGGCTSQTTAYPDQLAAKRAALETLFAAHWSKPIDVAGSPVRWHYRNKVDLNFAGKHYETPPPKDFQRETVLGFNRAGKWYWTLDLEECRIASPVLPELLKAVGAWAKGTGLAAFSTRGGQGTLKGLIYREGKRTGEAMAVLVTRPADLDAAGFCAAVRSALPEASVQWAADDSLSPAMQGGRIEVLAGEPYIHEELHVGGRAFRFRISPFSFFQTNTFATETLYGAIRDWVAGSRPERLYDLYGGSGGIAFACADLCGAVESVEAVASATEDGRYNAAANGIENVAFTTQPVEDYLRDAVEAGADWRDAVVVADPPRAGMHPKGLRRLLDLAPREIVYVSCKPSVLAGELERFAESYTLAELRAVDLFPHTEHVEAIARLTRRDQ